MATRDQPAEQAYLFRHALVRDAAYALQLPADRARLHRLALKVLEATHTKDELRPIAPELADHARLAQADGDASTAAVELKYTWQAADLARANYNPDSVRWLDAVVRIEPDPRRRVRALQLAADVVMLSARPADARPRLERALAIAREVGDGALESAAMHSLATIALLSGSHEEAVKQLHEAMVLARKSDNPVTEAMTLTNLAAIKRMAGQRDEGFEMQKQALAIHRRIGSKRGESLCLGNVAVYHSDCGRPEEALAACDEAIEAARASENRRTEGIVHGTRGEVLRKLGRLAEAAGEYRQAIAIHIEIYNRAYEAYDRCRLALVILRMGDGHEARVQWRQGFEQMLVYGHASDLDVTLPDMREACAKAGVTPFDATSGTG
jgi:tetratricopeptide (TPR) repeat protein